MGLQFSGFIIRVSHHPAIFGGRFFYRADTSNIDQIKDKADTSQAAIETLKVNLSAVKNKLYSANPMDDAAFAKPENLEVLGGEAAARNPATDNMAKLTQAANDYLGISAPDWGKRVRLKDKAAGEMANFIIDNQISKDVLTPGNRNESERRIVDCPRDCYHVASRIADTARILQSGYLAVRKHVRYRVLVAISTLNQQKLISSSDKSSFIDLINSYRPNADASLLNMIQNTITEIAK